MEESSFLNPTKVIAALHLHDGMRVADFGSGSGFFTRAAARAVGPEGVVWAVDMHQEMLSRVKNLGLAEGLTNIEVLHADVEKPSDLALPPASFDVVLCTNLFFGVENKHEVVRETRRVLKKHGRALVVDWRDSFGGLGPHQDHVVSEHAVHKLFAENDFVDADSHATIAVGAYHWGFVMRKK